MKGLQSLGWVFTTCAARVGCGSGQPSESAAPVDALGSGRAAASSGDSALRVSTDWGNPVLDLDLFVHGPSGELVASSANGTSTGEAVSVPDPAAGTWRVQFEGFLNTPTQYTGAAAVDRLVPLPWSKPRLAGEAPGAPRSPFTGRGAPLFARGRA